MSKLKDLKMSKKDMEESCKPCIGSSKDAPKYPYGTRLHFENDTLKKLDLDKLPKVGSRVFIEAEGIVESVSQNATQGGTSNRRVEIQLRKISLDVSPSSMEDAVDAGIDDAE